ncbi:cyclophilin 59 isoform X2 [Tasmannia lanceolata]|uniref:cyclophilin 59 isoform X2 n=1 Tax=Tasmannia lanceolata TaxID=3420 RepID=UPI004062A9D6
MLVTLADRLGFAIKCLDEELHGFVMVFHSYRPAPTPNTHLHTQGFCKSFSGFHQGRGCFKCGAPDHIAKDCAQNPNTKMQPPKYTLKEENKQHGGDARQSYEMVFDGETLERPEHEKRRPDHDTEDISKKWKRDSRHSEDSRHRYQNKRDSTSDRHRHDDRGRGHRDDDKGEGSKFRGSRKDDEYHGRDGGEKIAEGHRSKEDQKRHDSSFHSRDERFDRSIHRDDDHHKRHERDGRRNIDQDGSPLYRRNSQDDRKRSIDHNGDSYRREDQDDRKKSKDRKDDTHRGDERDDRKRIKDHEGDTRRRDEQDDRKRRDEQDDRKRSKDQDDRKRSKDRNGDTHRERDDRKRSIDHNRDAYSDKRFRV